MQQTQKVRVLFMRHVLHAVSKRHTFWTPRRVGDACAWARGCGCRLGVAGAVHVPVAAAGVEASTSVAHRYANCFALLAWTSWKAEGAGIQLLNCGL